MTDNWKNFKTAPKNGLPVILWISTAHIDGQPDMTATFFYAIPAPGCMKDFKKAFPLGKGWYSQDTGRKLTLPSIVKGWQPYAQPPTITQKFSASKRNGKAN